MNLKQPIFRSRKYTNAADGQPCVRCGANDGTVVAAHYTGLRQHRFGKGRGRKCSDLLVADLCARCHQRFDVDIQRKSVEQSEDFLTCVLLTIIRRTENGWKLTT